MIGAAPGTAETPRAHITNMAALGGPYSQPETRSMDPISETDSFLRMSEGHWA